MSEAFGSTDLFSAFKNTNEEEENGFSSENGITEDLDRSEILALQEENKRLKAHIRLIERFSHLFPCETPIAEVDFFKGSLSLECRARFEAELYTLLSEQRDDVGDGDGIPQGHVLYLPKYMIDSVGHSWGTAAPVQFGDHVPLFTNTFDTALDDQEDKLDVFGAKLPKENMHAGPECFNCGGPHRLAECKEPHDKRKIQEALKQFKDSRGGGGSNDRYHVRVVKEIEARYKEFQPGKISESLRQALGIENHELPSYIYRMRSNGYPPGYSLDPPLSNDQGMQFYYTPKTDQEDGEVVDTPLPVVIDYPGYTVPPSADTIDEHRSRNMPYSAATPTLSDKRPAKQENKRRKLSHPLGGGDEEDDMDVSDDGALLRRETNPPPPPPGSDPPRDTSPPPSPPGCDDPPTDPPSAEGSDPPPNPAEISNTDDQAVPPEPSSPASVSPVEDPPAATSTPLPAAKLAASSEATAEVMSESVATETSLNRSIVSETNKIGIKFDQSEDYGPLDERAGNFTKLQCILRSRKKAETPTTKTARTRSASRRGKK